MRNRLSVVLLHWMSFTCQDRSQILLLCLHIAVLYPADLCYLCKDTCIRIQPNRYRRDGSVHGFTQRIDGIELNKTGVQIN